MSVVLALGAAMVFGSADFLGGLASRRRAALAVAFGTQTAGFVALLVALPLLPAAVVAPRTSSSAPWAVCSGRAAWCCSSAAWPRAR